MGNYMDINDDVREFHSLDEFKKAYFPRRYKIEKELEFYDKKGFGKRLAEEFIEKLRTSLDLDETVEETKKEPEREKTCPEDFIEVKRDGT